MPIVLPWPELRDLADDAAFERLGHLEPPVVVVHDTAGDAPDAFDRWTDEAERARAGRFRVPADRRTHLAGRGIVRRVVALTSCRRADEVVVEVGGDGKPRIAGGDGDGGGADGGGAAFNVSHTGGVVAVVFSAGAHVGVDIERADRRLARGPDAVARRVLTPAELAALEPLSPADRDEAFVRAWTRKESVAKAVGRGLRDGLRSFEVIAAGPGGVGGGAGGGVATVLDVSPVRHGGIDWTCATTLVDGLVVSVAWVPSSAARVARR